VLSFELETAYLVFSSYLETTYYLRHVSAKVWYNGVSPRQGVSNYSELILVSLMYTIPCMIPRDEGSGLEKLEWPLEHHPFKIRSCVLISLIILNSNKGAMKILLAWNIFFMQCHVLLNALFMLPVRYTNDTALVCKCKHNQSIHIHYVWRVWRRVSVVSLWIPPGVCVGNSRWNIKLKRRGVFENWHSEFQDGYHYEFVVF